MKTMVRRLGKLKLVAGIIVLGISSFTFSQTWVQKGSDQDGEANGDEFGNRVALSADGSRMVVSGWKNDGAGAGAGHVRVYEWDGSDWLQLGSDLDGEAAGDYFGYAIDISDDGGTVVIGADWNDGNGSKAGHVRVFQWSGSFWFQKGTDIDGEAIDDWSGHSVAVDEVGNTIIIGAPGNDANGAESGHARVYYWTGSMWTQLGPDIDGEAAGDQSGKSVAMSNAGNTIAVGAYLADAPASIGNEGHVRVFTWSGVTWNQKGADIDGEAVADNSARSIALSGDGNTIAIGAVGNDDAGFDAGQVRVYEWSGSSWLQKGADLDGVASYWFGRTIDMSDDGNTIIVGSENNQARVYEWDGATWVQVGDNIAGEYMTGEAGRGVSIANNGTTICVGDPINEGSGDFEGHARVYELCMPTTHSFSVSECTSYTVPSGDETYMVDGVYNDTIMNAGGCDSIITITVTIEDVVAPVPDLVALPDLTGECSISMPAAPTASDVCAGAITATPDVGFSITTPGTTVITWTYDDGNGNTTTQTQNAIIDDVTEPVPDMASLPVVSADCSVDAPTAPTATDNCDGTITGTPDAVFPITTIGTTTVTWTFTDANGNVATQTQDITVLDMVLDTGVTESGNTLIADLAGVTYQWVDCDDAFAAEPGGTLQTFNPALNGNYAVIVSQGGCVDTSGCHNINGIVVAGFETNELNVNVYPNPATDNVNFELNGVEQGVLELYDLTGRLVLREDLTEGLNTVQLNGISKGRYSVAIRSDQQVSKTSLIVY